MAEPPFTFLNFSIRAAGCRNRCKHCSVSAAESRPVLIPLDQVEWAISLVQAESDLYQHINPCLFYEPMDYPDIVRVQELFRSLSPNAPLVRTMATNGQRIADETDSRQLIQSLMDRGVEQFQLTLHGLEASHDWFAGRRGAYHDLMEAAARIASAGGKIEWVYFLTKRNLSRFVEMVSRARAISKSAESISIWGPAGRAGKRQNLLVTADDLQNLPEEIRSMDFLPQYLPESTWVEQALDGRMHSALLKFRERARAAGGIPDCTLSINAENIADLPNLLQSLRETPPEPPGDPTDEEIRALAENHGDVGSSVLYRVSTMFHEWRRRQREIAVGES